MLHFSVLTFAFAPPSPPVTFKYGMNQVFGVAEPGKSTETIVYLGKALTLDGCKKKCLAHPTRCWSFTYHGLSVGAPYAGECFGLTSPRWSPTPDDSEIVSGQVAWSCRDDEDCSLNGKCGSNGKCACRPQWGGDRCETLRLGPAARNSGYRAVLSLIHI